MAKPLNDALTDHGTAWRAPDAMKRDDPLQAYWNNNDPHFDPRSDVTLQIFDFNKYAKDSRPDRNPDRDPSGFGCLGGVFILLSLALFCPDVECRALEGPSD